MYIITAYNGTSLRICAANLREAIEIFLIRTDLCIHDIKATLSDH